LIRIRGETNLKNAFIISKTYIMKQLLQRYRAIEPVSRKKSEKPVILFRMR